jgi:hypothetical protein
MGEVTFPETGTNSMIALAPMSLRVPRRILPHFPLAACGAWTSSSREFMAFTLPTK